MVRIKSKLKVLFILLSMTGICVFWRQHVSPFSLTLNDSPCACRQCISAEDPWFMQRFNASVEPFSSANNTISEDTFNWWKHVQGTRGNFSSYREKVDRLFQMFPLSPHVVKSSPGRCRTCAVVGNSGNLKGSHYGPLIDFHDTVIRINRARVKGFEADVGSRTTYRILYPESAPTVANTTHVVMFPFKKRDLDWLMKTISTDSKSHVKANKDQVSLISPTFMKYVHDAWLDNKGSYPSTGFMTVILALHLCDELHVFGFGADSDGNWSHYWEKLHPKLKNLKTGAHPGSVEYGVIQDLARYQKLKFYTGW